MRAAWWISISNFVFPCILQITQVGVVFHVKHQGQTDLQWFNECSVMMVLNGYFTIMGVVLATVWAEATNSSTISVSSGIRAPPSFSRAITGPSLDVSTNISQSRADALRNELVGRTGLTDSEAED
ncbi:hypothetical protein B0H14DRAFT_2584910 [Mycena olivaceomarginata]|nr:hypothetical protein B0H14DRAFT_2584910 [Mycena olivaceomarginata]